MVFNINYFIGHGANQLEKNWKIGQENLEQLFLPKKIFCLKKASKKIFSG